jgi:hypothetical protein
MSQLADCLFLAWCLIKLSMAMTSGSWFWMALFGASTARYAAIVSGYLAGLGE